MKKLIFISFIIFILWAWYFTLNSIEQIESSQEQILLEETKNISKEYVSLRYQTDNILLNAKDYSNYDNWNNEITEIINKWKNLDSKTIILEKLALEVSKEILEENISINILQKVWAYDKQEISNIYDKAPAWKKIATLAKHLWVDAKIAFKILQQDQAQVEADAWNEAWDTFQALESSATVIKDTCKIASFVWTIALTWWTAAIVWGSTIGQVAVVVSWADLVLEITDDSAKIALWNNNKISNIVWDIRVITEPTSSLLMITDLPKNLTKGIQKLGAISFWFEQLNSSVQEWKIIGIKLPAYKWEKTNQSAKVSVLDNTEIETWLSDNEINNKTMTKEEIEIILEINKNDIEKEIETINQTNSGTENNENSHNKQIISNETNVSANGVWEWIIKFTPSKDAPEEKDTFSFSLNDDKTVDMISEWDGFTSWEQEWNIVKVYAENNWNKWYYEFNISGNNMNFMKLAWPNSEWKWQEDFAWEDFFGGKFMQIELIKQ